MCSQQHRPSHSSPTYDSKGGLEVPVPASATWVAKSTMLSFRLQGWCCPWQRPEAVPTTEHTDTPTWQECRVTPKAPLTTVNAAQKQPSLFCSQPLSILAPIPPAFLELYEPPDYSSDVGNSLVGTGVSKRYLRCLVLQESSESCSFMLSPLQKHGHRTVARILLDQHTVS